MTGVSMRFSLRLAPFVLSPDCSSGDGILALFGQSGAGKTQTLECIAGLRAPDRGTIALGDRVLFRRAPGQARINVPPRRRRIGYVMQDGALFPHMTVLANVMYGIRGPSGAAEAEAMRLLDEMGIGAFADAMPREISGGQQRRAAIARAVATRPELLLLDEPFVHLDRVVRARLMDDLCALVRHRGIPAILVTHDLEETATCADRIAVMEDGAIVQFGTRNEVLFSPASCGIASLLGDVNVLPGVVRGEADGLWRIDTGGVIWNVPHVGPFSPGARVEAVIRSNAVKIIKEGVPVARELAYNLHRGTVTAAAARPGSVRFTVALSDAVAITGVVPQDTYHRSGVAVGDRREFAVDMGGISIFEARGRPGAHS